MKGNERYILICTGFYAVHYVYSLRAMTAVKKLHNDDTTDAIHCLTRKVGASSV